MGEVARPHYYFLAALPQKKKNPKALPPYSSEVIMCRPPPGVNPALHAAHAPLRREGATAGRALPIISLPGERRECQDDALKERRCLGSRSRHFSFRKLFLFHFLLCTHTRTNSCFPSFSNVFPENVEKHLANTFGMQLVKCCFCPVQQATGHRADSMQAGGELKQNKENFLCIV